MASISDHQNALIGRFVVVRDDLAGIHVGTMKAYEGRSCVLEDARKIYYWEGACTCHGIAVYGIDPAASLVAPRVESVITHAVVEVVPCSDEAVACLVACPEWRP